MKVLALVILLAAGLGWSAETLDPNDAGLGRFIITPFYSAPFPHPSRAAGHKYLNEVYLAATHYNDSTVALFIPKGFHATNRVDLVVHFHGWRNTVEGTLQQFKLAEQLVASGRNAILIVPEGPHDAPDSAGGKLEDPDGFKKFIAEAMETLKKHRVCPADAEVGNIILSGHSGGYRVMAAILDHGGITDHVREVWLFDALYANTAEFLAWAKPGQGRLINIYTDHGGTKENSEAMMATLKQQNQTLLATNDTVLSLPDLTTNHFVFLHSDQVHNDVIAKRNTFEQFLESSCLPVIPK